MPAPDQGKRRQSLGNTNILNQSILEEVARSQVTPETVGSTSGGIMYQGQAYQAKRSDTWQGIDQLFKSGSRAAVAYKDIQDAFDRRQQEEIVDQIEQYKADDLTDDEIYQAITDQYGSTRAADKLVPDSGDVTDKATGSALRDGNTEWYTEMSNQLGNLSDREMFRRDLERYKSLGPEMSTSDKQQWVADQMRLYPERAKYMWDDINSGLAQVKNDANIGLRKTAVIRELYGTQFDPLFNGTFEEGISWLEQVSEYPEMDDNNEPIPGTGGPFPGLMQGFLHDPRFNLNVYMSERISQEVVAASSGMAIDELEGTGQGVVHIEHLQPQIDQVTQWAVSSLHSLKDKWEAQRSALALTTVNNLSKTGNLSMDYQGQVVDALFGALPDIQGSSSELISVAIETITDSSLINLEGASDTDWENMAGWFPTVEVTVDDDGTEVVTQVTSNPANPQHRAAMSGMYVERQVNLLLERVNNINPELSVEADDQRRRNSGLDRLGFEWDENLEITTTTVDANGNTVENSTRGGWVIPSEGPLVSGIELAQEEIENAILLDAMEDFVTETNHLAALGETGAVAALTEEALGYAPYEDEVSAHIREEYKKAVRDLEETEREAEGDLQIDEATRRVAEAAQRMQVVDEDSILAMIARQRKILAEDVRIRLAEATTDGQRNLIIRSGERADARIEPTVRLMAGQAKLSSTTANQEATARAAAVKRIEDGRVDGRSELIRTTDRVAGNVLAEWPIAMQAHTAGAQSLGRLYENPNASTMRFYERAVSSGSWMIPDGKGGTRRATSADVYQLDDEGNASGILVDDALLWQKWQEMAPGEFYSKLSKPAQDIMLLPWVQDSSNPEDWIAVPRLAENLDRIPAERAENEINFLMDGLVSDGQGWGIPWSDTHQNKLISEITSLRNQALRIIDSAVEDGIEPEEVEQIRPALAVLHAIDARSKQDGYRGVMDNLNESLKTQASTSWTAWLAREYQGHWGNTIHSAFAEINPSDVIGALNTNAAGMLSALIILSESDRADVDPTISRGNQIVGQLPNIAQFAQRHLDTRRHTPEVIDQSGLSRNNYWDNASSAKFLQGSPGRVLAMTLRLVAPLSPDQENTLQLDTHHQNEMYWDPAANNNAGGWKQHTGRGPVKYYVPKDEILVDIMLSDSSFVAPFANKYGQRGMNLWTRMEEAGWNVRSAWEYYAATKLTSLSQVSQLSERIRLSNLVNASPDRTGSHLYIDPENPAPGLSRIFNATPNPAGSIQIPHSAMPRWFESTDVGGKGSGQVNTTTRKWEPNLRSSDYIEAHEPKLTTSGDAAVPGRSGVPNLMHVGFTDNWNVDMHLFYGMEDLRGRGESYPGDQKTLERLSTIGDLSLTEHLSEQERDWLTDVLETGPSWMLQEKPPFYTGDDWMPGMRVRETEDGGLAVTPSSSSYLYAVASAGSVFVPQTSDVTGLYRQGQYSLTNPSQLETTFFSSMTAVFDEDNPSTRSIEGLDERANFRMLARDYTEAVYNIQRYAPDHTSHFARGSKEEVALLRIEKLILERNSAFGKEFGYDPADPTPLTPEQEKALREALRDKALSYFQLPEFSDQGNTNTLTSLAVWSGFNNLLVDNNYGGIRHLAEWHRETIAGEPINFGTLDLNVDFRNVNLNRGSVSIDAQPILVMNLGGRVIKLPIRSQDLAPDQWGITSYGNTKRLFHIDAMSRARQNQQQPSPDPNDNPNLITLTPNEPDSENGE